MVKICYLRFDFLTKEKKMIKNSKLGGGYVS